MPRAQQYVQSANTLNYLGNVLMIGEEYSDVRPNFLRVAASKNGRRVVNVKTFPMDTVVVGTAGANAGVTENKEMSGWESTDFYAHTGAQNSNEIECLAVPIGQSYTAMAASGEYGGLAVAGGVPVRPINDLSTQEDFALRKLHADWNKGSLTGTLAAGDGTTTAGTMGGVITAVLADTPTDATSGPLTKLLINTEIQRMVGNGALFDDMAIVVGPIQYAALSDLYGFAPQSTSIGGVDLEFINVPYIGRMPVIGDPVVPDDVLAFLDMAHCIPVTAPLNGVDFLAEPIAKIGLAERMQIAGHASIDWGNVELHGGIDSLDN